MEQDDVLLDLYWNKLKGSDPAFNPMESLTLYERSTAVPGYIALGPWAKIIANDYIKSNAVLKEWTVGSGKTVAALPINESTGREAIRDALLQLGVKRVEVWSASGGRWACIKQGTPGDIGDFQSILFSSDDSADVQLTSIGAIYLKEESSTIGKYTVGVAFVNPTLRTLSVVQFQDNFQCVHLDSLITQFTVKEILVSSSLESEVPSCHQNVQRVLQQVRGVSTRSVNPKEFAVDEPLVQKFLQESLRFPETMIEAVKKKEVLAALSCLVRQWKGAKDDTNRRAFLLKNISLGSYMQLDAAAVQALNIVSVGQPEAPAGAPAVSIYGFLNRCSTGMGSRTMRQWLLQPLQSAESINDRLNMVEIMQESAVLRDSLRSSVLRSCTDMDRLNKKLQRGTAGLKDTTSLLAFVNVVPNVVTILKTYTGRHVKFVQDEFIAPLEEIVQYLGNLSLLIDSSIDVAVRETRIKPSFDDDLMELDRQGTEILRECDKEYKRAMSKYNWTEKQLKLENHASYGHVFRVARKDDKQVREKKELITVNTSKDGVRFRTEALCSIADNYKRVTQAYEKRQLSLKQKLMETIRTYLPILDDTKEMIAQLDVFVAWGTVASESRHAMVRPTIESSATNVIQFRQLRHSLVEARQANFVANDVSMNPSQNGLVITGPNMGGKSTYMRSVGVAVVLAQCGCFVPADAATVSVRDALLCRVGASDYLSRGVSTFMVEMIEASSILATTTASSLVIIDELGRGTSTYDGFGLAWAIAEEIACAHKSLLLFATHYHELTRLEEKHSNIRNVHVTANTDSEDAIQFLFQVVPGVCGRSFGVHVAKVAKLPDHVVEDARAKAAELERFGGIAHQNTGAKTGGVAVGALNFSDEETTLLQSAAEEIAQAKTPEAVLAVRAKLASDQRIQRLIREHVAQEN